MKLNTKAKVLTFFRGVTEQSIDELLDAIDKYREKNPKKEIVLQLCTPGGSVRAAIAFFETARIYKFNITTLIVGGISSMGILIWAAGKRRLVTRSSNAYFHLPGTAYTTEFMNLQEAEEIHDRLSVDYDRYINLLHGASKISLVQLKEIHKRNRTLCPDELLKIGLAHKVI